MQESLERDYLRSLAEQYLKIANLPVMKQREKLWYSHNELKAERPVIVMEMGTFCQDMLPALSCESSYGRILESTFLTAIINHEMIDDDKVVSPYLEIPIAVSIQPFGINHERIYAENPNGRNLGFRDIHFIKDLEKDLPKLRHSVCSYNQDATEAYKQFAFATVGDMMPLVETNHSLDWFFGLSQRVIELMGMEALMYALEDTPELVKELYKFVADDAVAVLEWQEQHDTLRMNNANNYAGSGSFGFSHELKSRDHVHRNMLWGNLNSQETVGISPKMFHEFIYPAYEYVASQFGLTYFGCCEPVHPIWNDIRNLPHLRKVSVSPWCDQQFMGNVLRGSKIIYSRKPSPNYLGVGKEFNETAYREHIDETLHVAYGCELEIIHRDIYTLNGNKQKVKRAVQIVREEIDKIWKP